MRRNREQEWEKGKGKRGRKEKVGEEGEDSKGGVGQREG